MEKLTDEELMRQVSNGNLDFMRLLYDRYHQWIYNFFIQMIHDKDACEDLMQTTFYKAIKYRKSYKGGKFDSWIFRIARNLGYDYFKEQKNRYIHEDCANITESTEENDGNEDIFKLKLVMQKLSPDEREILVLSRFQEMRYLQIAELLGSTENAVKVKAHRALKKLKKLFFESVEI
ncbi:RNA polymerase sigma24 factor [Salinimicrobium marinum]|uniref:RNA polymerase sigma24 factor n=1 Tax=Salinimicrobium marinum TaxID=680283 RepID=A0A918SAW1_9FLAO|nr:RNA polymerase sigma factor [Salinimicrobium marinum]GHA30481.1 RNA polymerase sigma24 factor [Salinimicrobium marinum]